MQFSIIQVFCDFKVLVKGVAEFGDESEVEMIFGSISFDWPNAV